MRAGQTVSATLPAAIIALALFRIPRFRGTLLEQNIARTAASVGEALVAGAVFTIPAFVMVGYWKDLRSHYWEATAILVCGGLLGVLFIILLRRPLCVEADLPWPESVAAANIVKAGSESNDAPRYIFSAMGFGALMQLLKTDKGLQIFQEYVEGFLSLRPRTRRRSLVYARDVSCPARHRLSHRPSIRFHQHRRRTAGVVGSHTADPQRSASGHNYP